MKSLTALLPSGGSFMTTRVRDVHVSVGNVLLIVWRQPLSESRARLLARAGVVIDPRRLTGLVTVACHQVHP